MYCHHPYQTEHVNREDTEKVLSQQVDNLNCFLDGHERFAGQLEHLGLKRRFFTERQTLDNLKQIQIDGSPIDVLDFTLKSYLLQDRSKPPETLEKVPLENLSCLEIPLEHKYSNRVKFPQGTAYFGLHKKKSYKNYQILTTHTSVVADPRINDVQSL